MPDQHSTQRVAQRCREDDTLPPHLAALPIVIVAALVMIVVFWPPLEPIVRTPLRSGGGG